MYMQRYQSCLSGRPSACVQVSQLGAMAAPALMMLTQLPSAASVPFFVWGPTAIAAGLLLWLLPDTLGASIPASVQVSMLRRLFHHAILCYLACYPTLRTSGPGSWLLTWHMKPVP